MSDNVEIAQGDNTTRLLALKTAMLPKDTNQYGTIFGGVLLSQIDLAAGIGARHVVQSNHWPDQKMVTVAMDRIEFHEPVAVGDTVSYWTSVVRIGRTSITIRVDVETDRGDGPISVTHGEATFVAVAGEGEAQRPVPLRGMSSDD